MTVSTELVQIFPSALIYPLHVRSGLAWSISHAALHNEGQPRLVLQHTDVDQRIAVDKQKVGKITRLHEPELVAALHDLATDARGRLQRLVGAEAEVLH